MLCYWRELGGANHLQQFLLRDGSHLLVLGIQLLHQCTLMDWSQEVGFGLTMDSVSQQRAPESLLDAVPGDLEVGCNLCLRQILRLGEISHQMKSQIEIVQTQSLL